LNTTRELKQISQKNLVSTSLDELEFEIPSWKQIYSFLLNLAKTIQNDEFRADIIIGISRGGWIPARILSDFLENTKLGNIAAEFYLGTTKIRRKPIITQPVSTSVNEKKILLVDDVADTGESLKLVNSHLKEAGASEIKVVTIYRKPWSSIVPDYYAKDTSLWIVFPWEIRETIRKTVEKYKQQGKTVKDVKEKLISTGLEKKLVEQFFKEIFGK
jgi:hypoxanthine phosphoribosyltransferase